MSDPMPRSPGTVSVRARKHLLTIFIPRISNPIKTGMRRRRTKTPQNRCTVTHKVGNPLSGCTATVDYSPFSQVCSAYLVKRFGKDMFFPILFVMFIGLNISERKSGIEQTKKRKKPELVFFTAMRCNWYCKSII